MELSTNELKSLRVSRPICIPPGVGGVRTAALDAGEGGTAGVNGLCGLGDRASEKPPLNVEPPL